MKLIHCGVYASWGGVNNVAPSVNLFTVTEPAGVT